MKQMIFDVGAQALLASGASAVTRFARLWALFTISASGGMFFWAVTTDHPEGLPFQGWFTVFEIVMGVLLLCIPLAVPMLLVTALAFVLFGGLTR